MDKNTIKTYLKIILVIASLYMFLVSIGLMSAAFKGFGKTFAENLLKTTSNPFVGLFIGILATSIVQSSSTTTSIVVGMAASGIITVSNAIPIIMGANIGTTVTCVLVSLAHITRREEFRRAFAGSTMHDFFNMICVAIMFPLELATGFLQKAATFLSSIFVNIGGIKFTSPIKIATKPMIDIIKKLFSEGLNLSHNLSNSLILSFSIIILFFSLYYLVKLMKSLVVNRTESVLDGILGVNGATAIIIGVVFTSIVQSSSVTTSLLVPLIGSGILTLEVAFPVTMGANIGTTTTAMLASFATGNPAAVTIAFVHFLFNMTGVLVIYPIKIFRQIPINLARWLGDLAYRKRRYAIIYVLSIFFIIPSLLIVISKIFK